MRAKILRIAKYLLAASKPAFWSAIATGVMPAVEHINAIRRLHPRTLIDVGANKGQFSLVARYLFPDIEIHAFEPLASEIKIYKAVIQKPVKLYAVALGAVAGERTFFITARPDSSSLLKPTAILKLAPSMKVTSSILTTVKTLKEVVDLAAMSRPILMKIDIQGGELEMLKGAGDLLYLIDAIYCEASFVRLYENQPLVGDVQCYLAKYDFALRGVFNQSIAGDLEPIQADFLFLRETKN